MFISSMSVLTEVPTFILKELGTSTFLFSDKTFLHVKQIDLQWKGNTKNWRSAIVDSPSS